MTAWPGIRKFRRSGSHDCAIHPVGNSRAAKSDEQRFGVHWQNMLENVINFSGPHSTAESPEIWLKK